jgi:hypothetical protein
LAASTTAAIHLRGFRLAHLYKLFFGARKASPTFLGEGGVNVDFTHVINNYSNLLAFTVIQDMIEQCRFVSF